MGTPSARRRGRAGPLGHSKRSPRQAHRSAHSRRLRLEQLENRLLLSTFTVTSPSDSGPGSLRQAILDANVDAVPDLIDFNIAGPGPHTIQPTSALPTITNPVTLDATTQPGFAGMPIIELDGSLAGADGLVVSADNSTVRGLVINRFSGSGIVLDGGSHNAVEGNFIGTDPTGTVALANGGAGIKIINAATWNRIGTDGDGVADTAERNLISGNARQGCWIRNGPADFDTSHNVVAGNFIGTDVSGTSALGNGGAGVYISDAPRNRIGTDGDGVGDAAERNLISANAKSGVYIAGGEATGNVVAGNFLGTDVTGAAALGNGRDGVCIGDWAESNLVGTDGDDVADTDERNVISGNVRDGVQIVNDADHNVVAGNFIGTDLTGTGALGNGRHGVFIWLDGSSNRIGTNGDDVADVAERNVISANGQTGVYLAGVVDYGVKNNVVAGNFIGTDATGAVALGNATYGVWMAVGCQSNRIGTDGNGIADTAERNVISGNGQDGVYVSGGSRPTRDNVVAGNYIGTDVTGSVPLQNQGAGVSIYGTGYNRIGTDGNGVADAAERNVISGNRDDGVLIRGSFNVVAGNYIGTDVSGATALGNGLHGVSIGESVQPNRIGTDGDGVADEAERNLISANGASGVRISGQGAWGNVVAGNYIGTDATGTLALGNGEYGVGIVNGAQANLIGTDGNGVADEAERNVISANADEGVVISGEGTNHNVVAGNYVGVDSTGSEALGNGFGVEYGSGIAIVSGAQFNLIGTNGDGVADDAERNVISANHTHGVVVCNADTKHNVLAGNFIGTDVTGMAALGNGGHGVILHNWNGPASENLIGTDGDGVADDAERNVISGNTLDGVRIIGEGTDSNVVAGNFIGTDLTGTVALANAGNGVRIIQGASYNRIGTDGNGLADTAERNVISANNLDGVSFSNETTSHNVVAGNFIGTDVTGTVDLGNGQDGVSGWRTPNQRIGGTNPGEGNLISGNGYKGVFFQDPASTGNRVEGNFIGTDVTGTSAIPNGGGGVKLLDAPHNTVGGLDPAARNVISGNHWDGVRIAGTDSIGNVVLNNYIGTDVTGTAPLPNAENGVLIFSGASGNTVGGAVAEARNVISANQEHGVAVMKGLGQGNQILGNYIGTDATGLNPLGNQQSGVYIEDSANNTVGGTAPGAGNLISANLLHGVQIVETDVPVLHWATADGGNGHYYVLAPYSRWFTADAGAVMAGGHLASITSQEEQDFINTAILGDDAFPNEAFWTGGTDRDSEGTFAWTSGEPFVFTNWRAGQPNAGIEDDYVAINRISTSKGQWDDYPGWQPLRGIIELDAAPDLALLESLFGADGNRIQGNSIYANGALGIDLGADGVTANDAADPDLGPNKLQNYPVIDVVVVGPSTRVVGSLNSIPNTEFTLDFYANTFPDPSGYGEGERWLGSTLVTTDAAGDAAFDLLLPAATTAGEMVTATATDPDGNTSEFSAAQLSGPGGEYRDVVMLDEPFAYYRLGEEPGATTAVDETGAHDGTYVNSPTLGVPGPILTDPGDTAAEFDDTQYVEGTPMDDYGSRLIEGFTIGYWAQFSGQPEDQAILGSANPGYNTNLQLTVYPDAGSMRLYFRDDDWDRYSVWFYTGGDNADVFDGAWHHMVHTYDPIPADPADRFVFYIDSVPQVLDVQPGNDRPDGTTDFVYPMILGGWHRRGTVVPTFRGALDEVAFYTRPLAPQEVAEHYGAATNFVPVAVDDADYRVGASTVLAQSAADGVLVNDWDIDGDELAAVLVDRPLHGTVALEADGSFRYAPEAGFVGADTFTYLANDGLSDSNLATVTVTVEPAPPEPVRFYFSLEARGTVGAKNVQVEDIMLFDGARFRRFFDGSDVGVRRLAIDAVAVVSENEILMSFATAAAVPGIAGTVDPSDLVKFTATQLGPTTAGTFELYFDGSDVGLRGAAENVDGVEMLEDGRLVFSTTGQPRAPGVTGTGEDLFLFTPTSLGPNTAGTWAVYFDGSDVGLGGGSVDAVAIDDADLLLSTGDAFSAAPLTADDEDVFTFLPTSLGPDTDGTYAPDLYFDGSQYGLDANDLVAVDLAPNHASVADDDAYDAAANQVLSVPAAQGVLAGDWDPDGDPLMAVLVDGPAHGTVVLGFDGSFCYVPNAGFTGIDGFTYVANDGRRDSSPATVTIDVLNQPPVAVDDSYLMPTGRVLTVGHAGAEPMEVFFDDFEDGASANWSKTTTSVTPIGSRTFLGEFGVESVALALDGLPNHDELIVEFDLYVIQSWDGNDAGYGPDIWSFGLEGEEPALTTTFTNVSRFRQAHPDSYSGGDNPPQAGASEVNTLGYASFGDSVYHIRCALESAHSSVRLLFAGSALQGVEDESWGLDNVQVSIVPAGVLVNDHDPDGNPLTAVIATAPDHGTVELEADGSFVYEPDVGFAGVDRFTYVANDGHDDSPPATVTIEVGKDLGTVDFLALEELDPSGGDLWYWLDSARDGYLTLEAMFDAAAGTAQLTLYDENFTELTTSTLIGGNQRIDRLASPGETYYLKLSGTAGDVDLRLANLVSHVGTEVTVYGTDRADWFEFDPAASRLVTINGVEYHFEDAEVTSATFDGGDGDDVALLYGDPNGPNRFEAWPGEAELSADDFMVRVTSVRYVHAYGNQGPLDVALLHGDPNGPNRFEAWPDDAKLRGDDYFAGAHAFRWVHAYGNQGPLDVALLHGDPNAPNRFEAWPHEAKLRGDDYFARAKSFRWVHAYGNQGPADVALLHGDPNGPNRFEAWPHEAKLRGDDYFARAKSFRYVHTYANRSGSDEAVLHDSALTDYLQAADDWVKLRDAASSFFYRASGYDSVKAYSTTPSGDIKRVAAIDYVLDLSEYYWQDP